MRAIVKTSAVTGLVVALTATVAVATAFAKPPDLSGVWLPDVNDQKRQETRNVPPWKPEIRPQFQRMLDDEQAGRPFLVLGHCLPHGMPSWMLITHNAFELLVTPGRITMLGEVDGNRMRRIYMDGRPHPEDPDLTLHGHSIGHWDGDTLVVDTVGIAPQAYIATSEAAGIPNNGGMHILERIHLIQPDVLADDLEITAPKVLSGPWQTTRLFRRYPSRHFEIIEGECVQEDLVPGKDQYGNDVFVPHPQNADGSVRAVK
jgi:hypothetical protein